MQLLDECWLCELCEELVFVSVCASSQLVYLISLIFLCFLLVINSINEAYDLHWCCLNCVISENEHGSAELTTLPSTVCNNSLQLFIFVYASKFIGYRIQYNNEVLTILCACLSLIIFELAILKFSLANVNRHLFCNRTSSELVFGLWTPQNQLSTVF